MAQVLQRQTELEVIRENPALGWLDEIFDSKDYHRDWSGRALECEQIYRNEAFEVEKFNIFWSNTDILRPLLFTDTPRAEVVPWADEPDVAADVTAKILEKTIDNSNDQTRYNLEDQGGRVVLDYLITGRGQAKVEYELETEKYPNGTTINVETGEQETSYDERKIRERAYIRHYNWRNFLHSRSKRWEDVWWVAFGHDMNRNDLVAAFGEVGRDVPLTGEWRREEYAAWRDDPNARNRKRANFAKVWAIWSKVDKQVIYVAEGYDAILKEQDDPYELSGFFPCPKPLLSVFTTNTLVPVPEFTQYQYQARELDILTRRINWLTDALRVRGIADASVKAFNQLFTAEDNEVILDDDFGRLRAAGGIDQAVAWVPLQPIAMALETLVKRREDALRVIYQITGLSDIMSGANNPYESAEAVEKKDKWGSTRIWERQKAVNRFFREMIALQGELIAEHYEPETILVASGVKGEELQAAGMQRIKAILESDKLRDYTISIHTNKTVSPHEIQRRLEIMEFMPGLAKFLQAGAVAIEAGALTTNAMHRLTLNFVQRFDFGRDNMHIIKAAIEESSIQAAQEKKMQQELMQADMQMKQKQVEAQMVMAQAEMAKAEVNRERHRLDFQVELEKIKVEWAKLSQKTSSEDADREIKLISDSIKAHTAISQVTLSNKGGEAN